MKPNYVLAGEVPEEEDGGLIEEGLIAPVSYNGVQKEVICSLYEDGSCYLLKMEVTSMMNVSDADRPKLAELLAATNPEPLFVDVLLPLAPARHLVIQNVAYVESRDRLEEAVQDFFVTLIQFEEALRRVLEESSPEKRLELYLHSILFVYCDEQDLEVPFH